MKKFGTSKYFCRVFASLLCSRSTTLLTCQTTAYLVHHNHHFTAIQSLLCVCVCKPRWSSKQTYLTLTSFVCVCEMKWLQERVLPFFNNGSGTFPDSIDGFVTIGSYSLSVQRAPSMRIAPCTAGTFLPESLSFHSFVSMVGCARS